MKCTNDFIIVIHSPKPELTISNDGTIWATRNPFVRLCPMATNRNNFWMGCAWGCFALATIGEWWPMTALATTGCAVHLWIFWIENK